MSILVGAGGGVTITQTTPIPPTPVFPPEGTQLPIFRDGFDRPNANTLGPAWGTMWLVADYPFNDTDRPGPYDSAVNPAIRNNGCSWIANKFGIGYSVAFPWPLAWMTQGIFDQYCQCRVTYIQSETTTATPYLFTVFSGNPGTLTGGFYTLGMTGSISLPNIVELNMGLAIFGQNPSATPDGIPGHAGLAFYPLQDQPDEVDVSQNAVIRFEARRIGAGWELRALANNVIVQTGFDNRLAQGMPAMGGSQFGVVILNINPLASTDDFEGGML